MRAAVSWEYSAVGSDQLGVTSPSARVHPRAYGTFVRVLGWGVRETGLFPLSEAVHGRPTRLDLGQVLRARQPMEKRTS